MISQPERLRDGHCAAHYEMARLILTNSSAVATISISTDGKLREANHTFKKLLGMTSESLRSSKCMRSEMLADAADWRVWERARHTGHELVEEMSFSASAGRKVTLRGDIWVVASPDGNSDWLFGAFVDVSNQLVVEKTLQFGVRAEAINSLASGLIHDFKNLLTILIGNLYLIAEGVRHDPKLFGQAKAARDVAKRGVELTQHLLSLSKDEGLENQALSVGTTVQRLEPLLNRSLGKKIRLHVEIANELSATEVNRALLEGAIINLVANARDAISGEGMIRIKVDNRLISAEHGLELGIDSGRYVSLAVRDDGDGIPEGLQDKVFDPFYSSKGERGGTGLGLSMVRWFARKSKGAVTLNSSVTNGTEVILLFPVSETSLDESAAMTMPLKMLPAGNEAIILVASDSSLRKTIEDSLSILGYRVVPMVDPKRLSQELSLGTSPLLIVESSMGEEANFSEIIPKVCDCDSQPSVLFVGGMVASVSEQLDHVYSLAQPFSLKELAMAVRAAVDRQEHD